MSASSAICFHLLQKKRIAQNEHGLGAITRHGAEAAGDLVWSTAVHRQNANADFPRGGLDEP